MYLICKLQEPNFSLGFLIIKQIRLVLMLYIICPARVSYGTPAIFLKNDLWFESLFHIDNDMINESKQNSHALVT